MNQKYKIIFIIAALLFFLSMTMSALNYFVSLHNAEEQLKSSSLPLSTDNIYNQIQTQLIEPNIVASMMAQDTFLKDWLINKEENPDNIKRYLESIKNKYQMHTVFLASEDSMNYYSSKGFVEQMKKDNPTNTWYYEFKNLTAPYEVNIDFNKHVDNSMIMFINHKIYDSEYHLLGVTGVGLKLSYIDEMLKRFRENYQFKVCFINQNGEIIIRERALDEEILNKDNKIIAAIRDKVLDNKKITLTYKVDGVSYLIQTRFIEELNLHLIVKAKVSDFTSDVIKTLYINFFLSLFITMIIVLIILQMVRRYSEKLEKLANFDELTNLSNRRTFDNSLRNQILLYERNKVDISILFFDIDDFKNVNDTFGHDVGDRVLQRFADIIKEAVRESDLVARWGGEEFVAALIDSSSSNSKLIAEKLRVSIEKDSVLYGLLNYNLTASFGLTQVCENDTVETILTRVDKALYEAKGTGKNKVILA